MKYYQFEDGSIIPTDKVTYIHYIPAFTESEKEHYMFECIKPRTNYTKYSLGEYREVTFTHKVGLLGHKTVTDFENEVIYHYKNGNYKIVEL